MTIIEFLSAINVLQYKEVEVTLKVKLDLLHKAVSKCLYGRMNPYHPISYMVIVILIIKSLLLHGFMSIKKIDLVKPFKWQKLNLDDEKKAQMEFTSR